MKRDSSAWWQGAAACIAIALPVSIAFNEPPSATFLNQAAALIGWPLLLMAIGLDSSRLPALLRGPSRSLLAAMLLLALAATFASWGAGLPWPLGLSSMAVILAAGLVCLYGAAAASPDRREQAFRALCLGLVVAGAVSALVAVVQVYWPGWADGRWIAASSLEGRASGNMRQPNHLSTLLLSSLAAVLWLAEARVLHKGVAGALGVCFVVGIVLSASRTGMVGTLLLGIWGVLDRRLSRGLRQTLIAAPIVYLVFWLGNAAWAHETHHVFAGEARLTAEGDVSSSRFAIWSNTLALIAQHPWLGVGFGEFNFAWSLTPFPHRPVAFFDHTHNLPLQLLVELGLPLGLLILGLLGHALYRAWAAANKTTGDAYATLRMAFLMVLLMMVHSMLEYPLWYAYFLLPTAFALGLCLGADAGAAVDSTRPEAERGHGRSKWWSIALPSAMLAVAIMSVIDYRRVVVIFSPPENAASLAQRIADGEHSWFFAHHAYYAAATITEHPSQVMPAFKVATHYLLDTRLMMAWASALNESGQVDKARYIAQRLREFRNDDAAPFFAPCDEPVPQGRQRPFQCTPPSRTYDYRDFR